MLFAIQRASTGPVCFRVVFGALLLSLLMGCGPSDDFSNPEAFPYTASLADSDSPFYPVDLTGDGRDERIQVQQEEAEQRGAVRVYTHERRTVGQVNFAGHIEEDLHFHDTNGDGQLEILVPQVKNDSLHLAIVDAQAEKQGRIFVTTGSPREESEGSIPWIAEVVDVQFDDVTANGDDEIIVTAKTRLARTPRGVFVRSFPEGEPVSEYRTGASITDPVLFNRENGVANLFFGSSAPNNGAHVGEMNDRNSYIASVGIKKGPEVEAELNWHRRMGEYGAVLTHTLATLMAPVHHRSLPMHGVIEVALVQTVLCVSILNRVIRSPCTPIPLK